MKAGYRLLTAVSTLDLEQERKVCQKFVQQKTLASFPRLPTLEHKYVYMGEPVIFIFMQA